MSPSWTDKEKERLCRLRNANPRMTWEKFQQTYFSDRSKDAVYTQYNRLVYGRSTTHDHSIQEKVTRKHSTRQAIQSLARKRPRIPGRQLRSRRVNAPREDDDSMKEDSEDDDEKTNEEASDQDSSESNNESSSDEDASSTEGEEQIATGEPARRTRENFRGLRKRAASDPASGEEATDDDAGNIRFNGGVCPLSDRLRRPNPQITYSRTNPRRNTNRRTSKRLAELTKDIHTRPRTRRRQSSPAKSAIQKSSRPKPGTSKPSRGAMPAGTRSTRQANNTGNHTTTTRPAALKRNISAAVQTNTQAPVPAPKKASALLTEALAADFVEKISTYLHSKRSPSSTKNGDALTNLIANLESDKRRDAIEKQQIKNRLELLEEHFYESVRSRAEVEKRLLAQTNEFERLTAHLKQIQKDEETSDAEAEVRADQDEEGTSTSSSTTSSSTNTNSTATRTSVQSHSQPVDLPPQPTQPVRVLTPELRDPGRANVMSLQAVLGRSQGDTVNVALPNGMLRRMAP
ncbi:uncharacterized protein BDV14DRAFT_203715 [Aspergillus stella-maris]|uniref:uncharacterized protein n=1 Tax=Aspergillus stella-maris TaxID=1810926 RepID=UPI003CCD2D17